MTRSPATAATRKAECVCLKPASGSTRRAPPGGETVSGQAGEDSRGESDVDHAEIIELSGKARNAGPGGRQQHGEEREGEQERPGRPQPRVSQRRERRRERQNGCQPARRLARDERERKQTMATEIPEP